MTVEDDRRRNGLITATFSANRQPSASMADIQRNGCRRYGQAWPAIATLNADNEENACNRRAEPLRRQGATVEARNNYDRYKTCRAALRGCRARPVCRDSGDAQARWILARRK
jgi:hypothetical protein